VDVQRYHARLRLLPCVVCIALELGRTPCQELHHTGDPTERNDWGVIPICHEHHEGASGIHGLRRRGFVKATKLSDVTLLALTRKLYAQEWNA
jgi:hypothetical protein